MPHPYSQLSEFTLAASTIGVAATALTDLFTFARRRFFGIASPDYRLVGRWLAYMPRGRFFHPRIAQSQPVRGELILGWVVHYAIGIAFASALLGMWGIQWAHHPTLLPALIVGVSSVAAPFLVMQPAMGTGVAARLTPRPREARLRSVAMHTVFGLGLYLGALAKLVVTY